MPCLITFLFCLEFATFVDFNDVTPFFSHNLILLNTEYDVTLISVLCFFSECDIDYICPSDYHPPDENSSDSVKIKNGFNEEDPYERIVRGNLQLIEKQKV